jgi:cyclic pyranopterin phosphate synthase
MKMDMKRFLRISTSGIFSFLKVSPKLAFLPSVLIYPTSACNYDCIMCESRRSNKTKREEMDFQIMEKLLNECASMRIKPRIHFSGLGEPLIYRHIDAVMEICKDKRLKWSITTNGLTLKKHARNLIDNHCHALNLSIHGTPSEHNRISGTHNAFERVITGLKELALIKKERGTELPLVAVNCVISNENVSTLNEIYQTFSQLPINSITFQHVGFSKKDLESKASYLILEDDKIKELTDFINFIESNKTAVTCQFFPNIRQKNLKHYFTNPHFPEKKKCYLPWLSVRVYPNGDVKMCDVLYGNLHSETLKSLINNNRAIRFRNSVRKGRFDTPVCFRCCHRKYN